MPEPPEHVEVRRINKASEPAEEKPMAVERPYGLLYPFVAGLILDFVDLATLGLVGLVCGWLIGGVAGWVLSGLFGVSPQRRLVFAILAGVYCMIPGTFFLPIATVTTIIYLLTKKGPPAQSSRRT